MAIRKMKKDLQVAIAKIVIVRIRLMKGNQKQWSLENSENEHLRNGRTNKGYTNK